MGRDKELAQLHGWLDKALNGERPFVFITGEPGIGKTTVVEAFLSEIRGQASGNSNPAPTAPCSLTLIPWIARGQCIEHYGQGEPYLPLLSAFGHVGRGPDGHQLIAWLRQHAPTWLVQLSTLLTDEELVTLQYKTASATRERMLRELAEALEAVTEERPLVLVLEDLQWSDPSTLDLLAFVARRSRPARLLILGSYRPLEMLSDGHPLKQVLHELYAHGLGSELALQRLTEREVSAYLTLRFPESVLPARLGPILQQRTGGNPLFLVSMVREMLQRSVLSQADDGLWTFQGEVSELERWTPESVRHVLARQRERLAQEEQRVLEAASLAGLEFSAAEVAAALETEVTRIEDHCGRLAEQQHFLQLAGISEWPDGTRAGRYGFLHALYQEFWHERVSVSHQQQWHLRIGERKEAAYGQRAGEIAAALAVHFAQGREYRKAVYYLQQAGELAHRRSAYEEAIGHLTKGLELLEVLPNNAERVQQEFTLQLALSFALFTAKGYAAPEAGKASSRALELCRQVGESRQLFFALGGLAAFYVTRGELLTARKVNGQMLQLAQSLQNPALLQAAHYGMGESLFDLGKLSQSRAHLEQAISLYDPQPRRFRPFHDTGVACLSIAALTLWSLGYPDQARQRIQEALTLAHELAHPFSLSFALYCTAEHYQLRREVKTTQKQAEALIALSREQGFTLREASGVILQGWALTMQGQKAEGISQIRQGLVIVQATGADMFRPHFLALLAEAYGKRRQTEEGLAMLAEALAFADKKPVYEAELYRLKGELTLQQEDQKSEGKGQKSKIKTNPKFLIPHTQAEAERAAEECFLKAIEVAQRQQAKSLELRATVSLARLWQQQGKRTEAHKMLSEVYNWFTEGFGTVDLKEAKALLEELSH